MRLLGLALPLLVAWAATTVPAAAAPSQPASPSRGASEGASPAPVRSGEAVVEEIVLQALAERGVATAAAGVQLTAFSARLPVTADTRLSVERVSYQAAGDRFIAVLAAAAPGGGGQRFTVAGRLLRAVEVPVPARRLQAGETIGPEDLQWVSVREGRITDTAVHRAEDLIGRVARRNLPAGTPVNAADLKRPAVVGKGAAVTLILEAPNMQLTARGRAMDEGAVGDTIRVTNLQSRMVVVGVVTPAGQVSVGDTLPPSAPAAGRRVQR